MNEYQTIEANGTTLILNEDMAMNLYQALAREFNWAGTFFSREDVRECINERRENNGLDDLEGDDLEEAVGSVVNGRDWHRWLPEWMIEQGWEIIHTIVNEVEKGWEEEINQLLEQEDN